MNNSVIHSWIILIGISLIFFALRVPLLNDALWHDEIYKTKVYFQYESSDNCAAGCQGLKWRNDWKRQLSIHPPLYYSLAVFFYYLIGDSEIALHLPMLFLAWGSVVLAYFFVREILDQYTAFLIALGLTVSEAHIRQSVNHTYPILEVFVFMLSLLVLIKFFKQKEKKQYQLLILTNLIGMLTFYHFFIYIGFQMLVFFYLRKKLKIDSFYFIIHGVLMLALVVFITIQYQAGRYHARTHWPKASVGQAWSILKGIPCYYMR
jgi:uncharacterized membrane protein